MFFNPNIYPLPPSSISFPLTPPLSSFSLSPQTLLLFFFSAFMSAFLLFKLLCPSPFSSACLIVSSNAYISFFKRFHSSSIRPSIHLFCSSNQLPPFFPLILYFLLWWLCLPLEVKPVWWSFKGGMFVLSYTSILPSVRPTHGLLFPRSFLDCSHTRKGITPLLSRLFLLTTSLFLHLSSFHLLLSSFHLPPPLIFPHLSRSFRFFRSAVIFLFSFPHPIFLPVFLLFFHPHLSPVLPSSYLLFFPLSIHLPHSSSPYCLPFLLLLCFSSFTSVSSCPHPSLLRFLSSPSSSPATFLSFHPLITSCPIVSFLSLFSSSPHQLLFLSFLAFSSICLFFFSFPHNVLLPLLSFSQLLLLLLLLIPSTSSPLFRSSSSFPPIFLSVFFSPNFFPPLVSLSSPSPFLLPPSLPQSVRYCLKSGAAVWWLKRWQIDTFTHDRTPADDRTRGERGSNE